jgi:TonB family protein
MNGGSAGRRIVVAQSNAEVRPQAPAVPDPESYAQRNFELTLLDLPTLPVSLVRQARCMLRERRESSRHPNEPEARLPISDPRPWYRELPAQIQALLATPKAAPASFSSRAADVPDLWQDYLPNPYSWANSLLVHLLVLTALVLPFALRPIMSVPSRPPTIMIETPLVLTLPHFLSSGDESHGGGSGGDRSPRPASHGALPPFALTQFTPPIVKIPNVAPLLPMPATLIGPPELKLPAMRLDMPWGDPSSTAVIPSQGPGIGSGIGNHEGTGVGTGKGSGYGSGSDRGCCDGAYTPGSNGVSEPVAIYSPEPAYSEEARKARFEGVVMLWIIVDAQGNVRNVRIAKPLGMGLDEEAVKTVSTWRFKPSMRQGVPVPVQAEVEVRFRLF